MRKWTWQWLVLLGLFGVLFSCSAWIDRQSYHIDEDVYKPSNPWKQMIWEAKVEIADFSFQIVDCRFEMCDVGGGMGHRAQSIGKKFRIANLDFQKVFLGIYPQCQRGEVDD